MEIDQELVSRFAVEFNEAVELRARQQDLSYIEDPTERFLLQEIVDGALNLRYAYVTGRAVAEQNRQPNIGPASFGPSNGATNP